MRLLALFGSVVCVGAGVLYLRAADGAPSSAAEVPTSEAVVRVSAPGTSLDPAPIRAWLDEHRLDDAAAALADWPEDDPEALLLRSILARKQGDADAAAEYGEAAAEALPYRSDARLAHARALADKMLKGGLLSAMRHVGTFKSELQAAIDLDPNNVEARRDQIGFLVMAPSMAGGDVDRARDLAEQLVAIDRRRGLTMVAWCKSADDDVEGAIETCRSALEEFPGDGELNTMLATILVEEDRVEEADAAFADAMANDKDESYYQALYQRGKLRVEESFELEQAIRFFAEYIEADPKGQMLPSTAGAWWRTGNAYEGLGRIDDAREAYRSALRADPDFERAQEALDDLD